MKYAINTLTLLIAGLWLAAPAWGQGKSASQEVQFDGAGVKLAGTLTWPAEAAGKRLPAVLIIAGSGPTPRDGITFGEAKQLIYRDLAERLAASGYASLRYDKRCVGASQCKNPETFDDYIDDAKGGLDFLRKSDKVDPRRVFLFGHSEGGLIASTLGANDEQGLAGVVLAASAGRNLTKLMREQIENRMTESGRSAADINAWLVKYDRVLRDLSNGRGVSPNEKLDSKDPYDALLLNLAKQYQVVVSLLVNDPLQIAMNIKSPVLILQGRKDLQISVRDAQYLEESLKRAHHPDATMRLFDDMDHLLKTNRGAASMAANQDAGRTLDTAMLTTLTDWMQKRAR